MALAAEHEAQHCVDALQSLLMARNAHGVSAWEAGNIEGTLALEVQRGHAALVKIHQLLAESEQWSGADAGFVVRVEALRDTLQSLVAAA